MAKYVWKHLPYAVYMDTNVLRSAGPSLNKQWISELLSITNEYGIDLCISELVLQEWCEHLFETLDNNRQKLFSALSLLKEYNIELTTIAFEQVNLPEKHELVELVKQKLTQTGFAIIRNWDAPLSQVLNDAVEKRPPFEHGGKGLCDAVILESYAKHAKENFSEARMLVISNDSAIKRSGNRFKSHGIEVEFIGELEIVAKLKSLMNKEVATYIEENNSRLKKYVLSHESDILEHVNKSPIKITDWMLEGPLLKEEDRIYGTIERILSIRPTKITKVIGGAPTYGEETPQDRYAIQIFVEIEIDIVVSQYGFGFLLQPRAVVQPDILDKNSPVPLERGIKYEPQEITKTIKRSLTIHASIDAEKEKQNNLDDFRIEKII